MSLQLFVWVGQGQVKNNKIQYRSFSLNDQTYHVGDCVYLYPEDEQYPPYIARILAAFVDQEAQSGADPHCIEVKWFERRVNLEPSTKGIEESEREVFELEDTDINPIGCISGKCHIVKANNYEEALIRCGGATGWYFCRGYFQQTSNSFVAYSPAEMAQEHGLDGLPTPVGRQGADGHAGGPAGHTGRPVGQQAGASALPDPAAARGGPVMLGVLPPSVGMGAGVVSAFANGGLMSAAGPGGEGEEEPEDGLGPSGQQRRQQAGHNPPSQQQPANKRQKATGRTCVECGATSTPQWREGPMGPKTLCNACGVRYVRSQQKAAGQKRTSAAQKNGQGRLQEPTPPRAQQQQQQERVTKRGTSQKGFPSEPPSNGGPGSWGPS